MQTIDPIEAVGLGQRKKSGDFDWRKNVQGMEWNRKAETIGKRGRFGI